MATNQQKLDNINARANWAFEKMPNELTNKIREAILWTQFDIAGDLKGKTSVGNEIRWIASNFRVTQRMLEAQTKNLISALAAVAKGEPFDEAKLLAGVQASAEAGVKAAIESIETTITMKKEK